MKKVGLVLVSLLCVTTAFAGQGDGFLVLNGGFLFNSTLDATIGYERELSYPGTYTPMDAPRVNPRDTMTVGGLLSSRRKP